MREQFKHKFGKPSAAAIRAKPSCTHCNGTGLAGKLNLIQGPMQGKIRQMRPNTLPLICGCVIRATKEKVPWLQRHGVDKQPWLQESNESDTPENKE